MGLDLALSKSEELLRESVLDYLRRGFPREILPELLDSDAGFTSDMWPEIVKMGWLGIIIPETYGGEGYAMTEAGVLFEALGTAPLPGPYFSTGILSSLIVMQAGDADQKAGILPEVASGRMVLIPALNEAGYNWTPGTIQTTAGKAGQGFVLNGIKLFTPDAMAATHFIVAARAGAVDPDHPADGISLFLVDRNLEGISIKRMPGYLSGRVFEVRLNGVSISDKSLLGQPGRGWSALEGAINKSIPVLCAYKVGGCQAAFDLTLEYSRERKQFGQPIGRFQRVQDMIIEMVNHTDAARWTTYEALWKLDTDQPAAESLHLAKAVTSEAYWQVCTLGHRAISGLSYSMEHPLAFHTRTSRSLYNYLGEPAFHRQKLANIIMSDEGA